MRLLCALILCAALRAQDAGALKAHVSFLASDVLEGRATPSRGLDVAAEYIASEFRRLGIEPAGDDGYFQTAPYFQVTPKFEDFELTFQSGGKTFTVPPERIGVQNANAASIEKAEAVKIPLDSAPPPVAGKVALIAVENWRTAFGSLSRSLRQLQAGKPAAIVLVAANVPFRRPRALVSADDSAGAPVLMAGDAELLKAVQSGPAVVTLRMPEPLREPVKLRNVAAIVRGADPVLKDTYVLVSAHYDHVGVRPSGEDRIMNGANDNASGTASMIEVAGAAAHARPRRSMLFIAWFGEEVGLLGSRYYVRHPLVPLERTVVNLNLEQTGRTDDPQGSTAGQISLTGYDFSDVPAILARAAAPLGIRIVQDGKRSDPYFARSDNVSFAEEGIPAHTLCAAFEYSDYHAPGDEWNKLDYANMERVTRAIAAGALELANRAEAPHWNASQPRAARYINKKAN